MASAARSFSDAELECVVALSTKKGAKASNRYLILRGTPKSASSSVLEAYTKKPMLLAEKKRVPKASLSLASLEFVDLPIFSVCLLVLLVLLVLPLSFSFFA